MTPGLLLVDGNPLAWRYVKSPQGPDGRYLGILHGVVRELLDLSAQFTGWRVVLVFDEGGSSMRRAIDPSYKANRIDTEDRRVISSGLRTIKSAFDSIRANYISINGVEADDIISILATRCRVKNIDALIVSEDKDLYQCLGGSVRRYSLRDRRIYSANDLLVEFDGDVRQYLMFLALCGDRTDNVPGMPKIGKVKALELVKATKGDWRKLFGEQIARIYGEKKAYSGLFQAGSKKLFLEQVRLVRTCRSIADLFPSNLDAKSFLESTHVHRVIGESLRRHIFPIELSLELWSEFLSQYGMYAFSRDLDRFVRLFGFKQSSLFDMTVNL